MATLTPLSCALVLCVLTAAACAAPGTIRAHPAQVRGEIDPFVYGQFLEHIYHSVEDGLYGELVRNRAFVGEQRIVRSGDGLLLETPATDIKLVMGSPKWTDYEFALMARKSGGAEGFLILVRATDDRNFYWWNIGGWGNTAHQLEVERNDARQTVGPRAQGRIEAARWYEIRMRVEGDHIQGWLDGALVLDMRDATHARGGVGVGFWATKGEYRDLRVTDLSGKALPLPLQALPDTQSLPAEWTAWPPGGGEARLSELSESPNTGTAAEIVLHGPQFGIAQARFNAIRGRRYRGSMWLKTAGDVRNVTIALRDAQGATLSRQVLAQVGDTLQERKFTLTPRTTDTQAMLTITAEGTGRVVVDMVSMMRDDYIATGCRSDLLGAVQGLKPPIIRWPGGCFASIYRWKRAIGPQHTRKPFHNYVWGEWDFCGFGTDEFIRLCRVTGAEPLIVVNLGSWDDPAKEDEYVREALEWIEYCNGDASTPMGALRAANGHPEPYNVVHWEMDNETWGLGVERYGKLAARVCAEIRRRWPGLKLYACTFWEKEDGRLLELCGEHIDYISYHFYENPDAYATAPSSFEALWRRYDKLIAASKNPKVRLAITEWNAQSTDWRTGLFAGGFINVMERSFEIVTMATPALFLRRVDATDWDNAFINHDHLSWFPAPNYVVMKLFRDHFQPQVIECEAPERLNVVATRSRDGRTVVVKVVNPGSERVEADIVLEKPFRASTARARQVAAHLQDRNTLAEPKKIAPAIVPIRMQAGAIYVALPPLSVTVVEIRGR